MEMRGFDVEFTIRQFWPEIRPDAFNNTSLFLENKLVWPLEEGQEPPVMPARGVRFRLEIPSGVLQGEIWDVVKLNSILEEWWIIKCTWAGKFAGLTGGSSGIGSFRFFPRPETIVISSISEEELTYGEYIAIRRMADAACGIGGPGPVIRPWPEEKWELMRSALKYLKALREEAQRLCEQ